MPPSRPLARALFFVNTLLWVLLGVVFLLKLGDANSNQIVGYLIVALLMFGNAGAMLVCGVVIVRPRRIYFYLALAVLAVNIVLTFTDQVGLWDIITLLIDLVLVGLLVAMRRTYTD
jgi:hypothetical protein